jgi:hypothetical protein
MAGNSFRFSQLLRDSVPASAMGAGTVFDCAVEAATSSLG